MVIVEIEVFEYDCPEIFVMVEELQLAALRAEDIVTVMISCPDCEANATVPAAPAALSGLRQAARLNAVHSVAKRRITRERSCALARDEGIVDICDLLDDMGK